MEKDIPLYQKSNFKNINTIELLIGTSCNMYCRHCTQMPIKKTEDCYFFCISEKVLSLLEHFIEYNINNKIQNSFIPQIIFCGGEPLLYWDSIKKTIIRFTEKYGIISNKGCYFSMTSNGLLLTSEIVDFINNYNIMYAFSYDAPFPFAVRGQVSDTICELVKKIKNYKIYTNCGNAINCDPLLAYECLKAKFPNASEIKVNSGFKITFDMPKDIYKYDWKKIKENLHKLRIAAQLGNSFALNWYKYYLQNLYAKSYNTKNTKVLNCANDCSDIAITTDGKYSFCPNCEIFTSTIDDSWNVIMENNLAYEQKAASTECTNCRHVDICYWHCLLDIKNENGGFITCSNYWLPLYDIIKIELANFAKPLSEEDRIWYKEQEEIMKDQIKDFLNEGKK